MTDVWPGLDPDLPHPSPVLGHGKVTALYQLSTRVYEDGCALTTLSHLDSLTRQMVVETVGSDPHESPTRTRALLRLAEAAEVLIAADEEEVG